MTTRLVHVDPEADFRLLVRLALEPATGFAVVAAAAELADAAELVATAQADAVLVEPHARGAVDLAGLVALRAMHPHVPVIVLSSLPLEALGSSTLLSGSIGYVSKSVRPTRLAAELAQLLSVLQLVDDAVGEARTELDNDLVSPRRARQFVTETMERWNCEDATTIIDLLVSELVANAVMHAGTTAELAVQLLPDRVRVSVADGDPSHPKRRPDDPHASTGRGIALIEQLSLAWGIERLPAGKRIWFETPRPDAGDPVSSR